MTKTSKIALSLLLTFTSLSSAFASDIALNQRLAKFDLHVVQDGAIYRGGRPHRTGMLALKEIGVRTIIGLQGGDFVSKTPFHEVLEAVSPGERISSERDEAKDALELGLNFVWAPLSAVIFYTNKITYREDKIVDRALAAMNDSRNYPIYVHCTKGRDRTGMIIALWRVQNGWSPEKAHAEWVASGHRGLTGFLTHTLDSYFFNKAAQLISARETGRN